MRIASEGGFSIPEVCVAAGLIGTALVTLAALFALAADANGIAGDLTWATILARTKLEELLAPENAEAPADGVERYEVADRRGMAPSPETAFASPRYRVRWRIEPLAGSTGGAALVHVEVTREPAVGRTPLRAVLTGLRRVSP